VCVCEREREREKKKEEERAHAFTRALARTHASTCPRGRKRDKMGGRKRDGIGRERQSKTANVCEIESK